VGDYFFATAFFAAGFFAAGFFAAAFFTAGFFAAAGFFATAFFTAGFFAAGFFATAFFAAGFFAAGFFATAFFAAGFFAAGFFAAGFFAAAFFTSAIARSSCLERPRLSSAPRGGVIPDNRSAMRPPFMHTMNGALPQMRCASAKGVGKGSGLEGAAASSASAAPLDSDVSACWSGHTIKSSSLHFFPRAPSKKMVRVEQPGNLIQL